MAIMHLPKEPLFHYRLGMIYFRLGKKEKAKEEFKKVTQLDKGNLSQAAKQMLEAIE